MGRQNFRVLTLASRNIWRNTRRTVITVAAVVFAVTLAIFSWSVKLGEYEQMINDALKLYPGHLQVHAKGYWDDKTIYNSFSPPGKLLDFLKKDDRVKAYTERLSVDALISSDTNTSGVLVVGIVPEREFSTVREKIKEGSYLSTGNKDGILIGDSLAKNLSVSIGGEITILTQAYDGSIGAGIFKVSGIYRSGSADFDRSMAFVDLPAAQNLLSMDGPVTELTVLLKDSGDTDKQQREIAALLDPKEYEVMPWRKLIPDLVQFVDLSKTFGSVYYLLILIVVGFGILNTILMAVMERYREFGVMMALGTRPSEIVRLVMVESTLIALIGIVIGDALGFSLSYYFTQVPMNLSAHSDVLENFGLNPLIYAKLYPWIIYVTDLIVLGTTLLSAIYPAVKASRLSPVRALRYV
jgi:ABC-type lipoprotein release transport system permease subunit